MIPNLDHRPFLLATLALLCSLFGCTGGGVPTIDDVRELQQQGQIQESIDLLIQRIESGERDGETLYRFGRALSITGQPGRSVWALDAALKDPEWLVRASHQLALDAYQSGNFELVLEILERLREEREDDPAEDYPALMIEARAMLNTRRHFEPALELLDSVINDYPDEEEPLRLKAVALLGLKRSDEAYELIREKGILATELDSTDENTAEKDENPGDAAPSSEASIAEADDAEKGDESSLALESEEAGREAYWCTVRMSFNREAGKLDNARKITEGCLAKFPSAPDVLNEAVQFYTTAGPFNRIVEILEAANEDKPDNTDLRMALVSHYNSLGRFDDAEGLLRKALADVIADPESPEVQVASYWVDLAGFMVTRERTEEALDAFGEAIEILGERASPALLFRQAESMIVAERYDEALAIADKTPIEVHQPMIRGRVAFERGEFETAQKELAEAARVWPNNAPIRYYLARALEATGDFDQAIEDYRHAMRSDPALSAPRERLTKLHLAEGRIRHAASILQFESPKKSSTASTALRMLWIEVQTRLGKDPSLNIPPDPEFTIQEMRTQMVTSLARGLDKSNTVKPAADLLGEIEERLAPGAKSAFLRARVALLVSEGRSDEALAAAKAAARTEPDDPDLRLALGQALVASNAELDEAERLLGSVLVEQPENVPALISQGDLALIRGDKKKADALFDQALELAPDDWSALKRRLDSLSADGNLEEANRRLEYYLAVGDPYDGNAALLLAEQLEDTTETQTRRIELATRALRFGAGQPALDLYSRLDPEGAAAYKTELEGRRAQGARPEKADTPNQQG